MRIVHLCQLYHPSIGGCEHFMKSFSEELVRRGHQVDVFVCNARKWTFIYNEFRKELPEFEVINGVRVHRFSYGLYPSLVKAGHALLGFPDLPFRDFLLKQLCDPFMPKEIIKLLTHPYDILLINPFPIINSQWALLLKKARRELGLMMIPCLHVEVDPPYWTKRVDIETIRAMDKIIALTRFEKEFIHKEIGVEENKIMATGVGVEASPFQPLSEEKAAALRKKKGYAEDAKILLFVGRQIEQKGIAMLIHAFAVLAGEDPSYQLLIAGAHTDYSLRLRESVTINVPEEVMKRVRFIDTFQEEEKPDIFALADLFILPSVIESFGIAYLEAWLMEKPVIGADVPTTRSMIEKGTDGSLVPHGDVDALVQEVRVLMASPETRRKMGKAGRKKVLARYQLSSVVDRWEEAYMQLVKEKQKAGRYD